MRPSGTPPSPTDTSSTPSAPIASPAPPNRTTPTLIAFFFSGVSALFYQVIWMRKLTTVFGNTTLAVSITLAAFMAGLAIGSYLFGRRADRVLRPLRLYALLEIAIGIYGLVSLALLGAVHDGYVLLSHRLPFESPWLVSFQFWASFLVLIAPTALMGGTLPVAIKGLVRDLDGIGPQVGKLYGVNTLGAAAGVLLVGFFLLPVLGLPRAVQLAAAINLAVGIAILIFDGRVSRSPIAAPHEAPPSEARGAPLSGGLLLALPVGFALSGFSGLALEVVWARAFALCMGSSVFAFSAVLLAVLLGIALGSLVVARLSAKHEMTPSWFAAALFGAGASTLALIVVYGQLPFIFRRVVVTLWKSYPALLAVEVLVIAGCMLIPTLLAGAAFPIASRLWVRRQASLSRAVGVLYAANTVGCIAGALAAGFLFIPHIGLRATVLCCAGLYVVAGAAVLSTQRGQARLLAGLSLILFAEVALLVPRWHPVLLSSGLFRVSMTDVTTPGGASLPMLHARLGSRKVVFYREGSLASVAVLQWPGRRALLVNGKPDASDGPDMDTQLLVAHLPMLLAPRTKSVLVVGMGSGTTCGAAALHQVDKLDCVEIEPAVVAAARYFKHINRNVLSDPRFHVIAADARNYLAATRRRYNVIISEPSNPWVAGVASLFTVEHFQALRDSLADDGIICQWLQLYETSPREISSVISTFVKVFPDATLWWANRGPVDVVLIAQKRPWTVDLPRFIARAERSPGILYDLRRSQFKSPMLALSYLMFGPADLRHMAGVGALNTDDFPTLEFLAPRNLYRLEGSHGEDNLAFFVPWRAESMSEIVQFGPAGRNADRRAALAAALTRFGPADLRTKMNRPWAREQMEAAAAFAPGRADLYEKLARIELAMKDIASARAHLQRALALAPGRKSARDLLAKVGR